MSQQAISPTTAAVAEAPPAVTKPATDFYQHRRGSTVEMIGVARHDPHDEHGVTLGMAYCHDYDDDQEIESVTADLPLYIMISQDDRGRLWYFASGRDYGNLAVFRPQGLMGRFLCMPMTTFERRDDQGTLEFERIIVRSHYQGHDGTRYRVLGVAHHEADIEHALREIGTAAYAKAECTNPAVQVFWDSQARLRYLAPETSDQRDAIVVYYPSNAAGPLSYLRKDEFLGVAPDGGPLFRFVG